MNNNNPLVSVIVTTYNREIFLKETIDSILNQIYMNFELIIVDNYSDYDFLSHIRSFNDDRITAYQNSNDGVIAVNRNYGIEKARGKYIAFCDDDDLWTQEKLMEQVKAMAKQKVGMVYSICKLFGSTSFLSNMYGTFPLPYRAKPNKKDLLKNNTIPFSTVMVKRTILDKMEGFDKSRIFFGIEDYELWLRISETSSIMFIPRIHTYYRIHPTMTQLQNPDREMGIRELHRKHGGSYTNARFCKERNMAGILLRSIYHKFFEILIAFHFFDLKLFRRNFIKT